MTTTTPEQKAKLTEVAPAHNTLRRVSTQSHDRNALLMGGCINKGVAPLGKTICVLLISVSIQVTTSGDAASNLRQQGSPVPFLPDGPSGRRPVGEADAFLSHIRKLS